jgi:hypothetical protein
MDIYSDLYRAALYTDIAECFEYAINGFVKCEVVNVETRTGRGYFECEDTALAAVNYIGYRGYHISIDQENPRCVLITNVPKLNFLFQGLYDSSEEDVEGVLQISTSDHLDDHRMSRSDANRTIPRTHQGHAQPAESHHDGPHRLYQAADVRRDARRPTTLRRQTAKKQGTC